MSGRLIRQTDTITPMQKQKQKTQVGNDLISVILHQTITLNELHSTSPSSDANRHPHTANAIGYDLESISD